MTKKNTKNHFAFIGFALILLCTVSAGLGLTVSKTYAGNGTAANDKIVGSSQPDLQNGKAGSDVLIGGKGADTQFGGPGKDVLLAGPSKDVLVGGPGQDVLKGGAGADVLNGGPGADTINCGSSGNDTVYTDSQDTLKPSCQGSNIIQTSPDYQVVSPVQARLQWNANFGYCGETSFIAAGMSFGQYTSQWTARSLANPGVKQTTAASQLLPEWPQNSGGSFLPPPVTGQDWQVAGQAMKLNVSGFDTYNQMNSNSGTQATANFLSWIKTEMVDGNRVIIGVLNNTNVLEESGYGQAEYDHVVPVVSVGSNSAFAAAGQNQQYLASDTITIGDNGLYSPYGPNTPVVGPTRYTASNFGAGNTAGNSQGSTFYTNTFKGIVKNRPAANTYTPACSNCLNDAACNASCSPYVYSIYSNTAWPKKANNFPANLGNYGFSISGVTDPNQVTVPVSLKSLTATSQPLNNEGTNPGNSNQKFVGPAPGKPSVATSQMQLEATVKQLQPGTSYNLYLYNSFAKVPVSGFNAKASQAVENWSLTWNGSSNSWTVNSSTSTGSSGSCSNSSCKVTVSSLGSGSQESNLVSNGTYILRAVPVGANN